MIEALWSVEFFSNLQAAGSGVAVLKNGRILGGDAQYFYEGTYIIEDGKLLATLNITHYSGPANSIVGGLKQYNFSLSGTPSEKAFEMDGQVTGNPSAKVHGRLTRRAEF